MAMIDKERLEILRLLQEGADTLDSVLNGVDDSTARRRHHPGSWSVLECVEHLTLTEAALLARLREAKACDETHEDRAREAKFQDLALNRLRRIDAPEPVLPRGNSKTLAQAVEDFATVRSETVRFVQEFPGELRWWLTTHPLITRPVNCYEMLLLMALHPKRHALQIEQTREILRAETRSS
jgi:DinB superfamily